MNHLLSLEVKVIDSLPPFKIVVLVLKLKRIISIIIIDIIVVLLFRSIL